MDPPEITSPLPALVTPWPHNPVAPDVDVPRMSFNEAANYMRISPNTLRCWLFEKRGPRSYKIGKYRRFRRSDLDAFLEQHAEEPAG